jgi:GTP 3',8-cyclase
MRAMTTDISRSPAPLVDPFGRFVSYLRVSVTDRCDFRCVYCMSEDMTFLPKAELLTLEELDKLCSAFVRLGVEKIRITGGEPLVRRGIMDFINAMSRHLDSGALKELTLTTNGSQLSRFASDLFRAGIRRVNVSLDTLQKDVFEKITRWGKFDKVMEGIDAALGEGLEVKLNAVALRNINIPHLDDMIRWCGEKNIDLTLIETMPMGNIEEDRFEQYIPLDSVLEDLRQRWNIAKSSHATGGPARYFTIEETGKRLGLITPLSHNFCEGCNRVRLTCTGQLYMCLGQDDHADLRSTLRAKEGPIDMAAAIREAITRKPKGHDFVIDRENRAPAVSRHMSVTGG